MPSFLRDLIYFHGLFVLLLYFVGNFFTIIILEYQLRSNTLRHTLAAFVCVAFSGVVAYYVPVWFFDAKRTSVTLQFISVAAACSAQGVFWAIWFRKKLRSLWPALLIAFVLSVIVALLMYNLFLWYVRLMVKGAVRGAIGPAIGTLLP